MKLGHVAIDNTPGYPVFLSGYPRKEKAENVHLPVEIHAICLELNQHKFALCAVDTIVITDKMCDQIRREVVRAHVLEYNNIHICATHTHSAPCLAEMNIPDPPMEPEWCEITLHRCAQAIIQSAQEMQECECYFALKEIEGFYGNRNDIHGIENKNVYVFTFFKQEKVLGRFLSLSCHNTVNSVDNVITSDLFGAIRAEIRDGFTMLVNGASGDISTRNYRQGCDCREVDRMGKQIANIVMCMDRGVKVKEKGFRFDMISTHVYQDIHNDEILNQRIKELEEKKENGQLEGWDDFTLESYLMRREKGEFYFDMQSYIAMNEHYIFITIPGELLTCFDYYFREKNPKHQVILITTCDGYAGYLVQDGNCRDFEEEMAMVKPDDVWRHIKRIQRELMR